jgi:hypothetical protein
MMEGYKEEFGSYFPFDEGGLNLLVGYRRGIFRRFFIYIQLLSRLEA